MIDKLITANVIKEVSVTIAEYCFGKFGDYSYYKIYGKYKIRKILNKDIEYIDGICESEEIGKKGQEYIKHFLIDRAFQNIVYLTLLPQFPSDKEEMLWFEYSEYIKKEFGENYLNEKLYRGILIDCIMNHNKLIVMYLMKDSERILFAKMEQNHADLLGFAGNTLNANSELQEKDVSLDYVHKQIESILHSLRMDLRHYKLQEIIFTIGVILYSIITILVMPQLIRNIAYSEGNVFIIICYIILILFFICIFLILAFLFYRSSVNVIQNESKISGYMGNLWDIHYEKYKKYCSCLESD